MEINKLNSCLSIILIVISILLVVNIVCSQFIFQDTDGSIAVIGGADGPTAIYTTSNNSNIVKRSIALINDIFTNNNNFNNMGTVSKGMIITYLLISISFIIVGIYCLFLFVKFIIKGTKAFRIYKKSNQNNY